MAHPEQLLQRFSDINHTLPSTVLTLRWKRLALVLATEEQAAPVFVQVLGRETL